MIGLSCFGVGEPRLQLGRCRRQAFRSTGSERVPGITAEVVVRLLRLLFGPQTIESTPGYLSLVVTTARGMFVGHAIGQYAAYTVLLVDSGPSIVPASRYSASGVAWHRHIGFASVAS